MVMNFAVNWMTCKLNTNVIYYVSIEVKVRTTYEDVGKNSVKYILVH